MGSQSIQNKSARPSSFSNYSYYNASRGVSKNSTPKKTGKKYKHRLRWLILLAIIIAAGFFAFSGKNDAAKTVNATIGHKAVSVKAKPVVNTAPTPSPAAQAAAAATSAANAQCAGNTLDKQVFVSIADQHLWACDGTTSEYDSAVITGIAAHPDTLTPTGTYYVYGKYTDTTLKGCDSTGCWSDPVSYWMPFLHNQYGSYGFHDATWRDPSLFGNVSPSSSNGSQGCVELPLATAAWLYNWISDGTAVTIKA
jgi:lipoprotein-anchoring transpeptidase ErfK/SrfK